MFSYHIETQFFGFFNIKSKGFIGRCCIEAVGPPPLVQRSELEDRFAIQGQADDAVLLDTTELDIEQSFAAICALIAERFNIKS